MNSMLNSGKSTFTRIVLIIIAFSSWTFVLAGTEPVTALNGLDPVALIQGTEAKGTDNLTTSQGRYRYHFANAENKRRFEESPGQYGIQFDGYCMNMGPLSGRGSPDRWLVVDGRIYLFASDGCRSSFKSDPKAFTDRPDEPPTGSEAEKKRGLELIDQALVGLGGADKLDALKSIRWEALTIYEQDGKKTESRQTATVVLPDRLRLDYSYGSFKEGHALADGSLVEVGSTGDVTPLPADVREFVRRRLYREPLALLRARQQPGFVAYAAGTGEVQGEKVNWLKVGYAGATTRLGIAEKTGRILAAIYRGRAPSKIGEISKTFSDFKPSEGGLILPEQWDASYGGNAAASPKPASKTMMVNVPVDAAMFPKAH